jgi:hypothetical protein
MLIWHKNNEWNSKMPRKARSRDDGYCLIYEENKRSPIGEVKTQGLAERLVMRLWGEYGPRFDRSEPASTKRLSGSDDRFRRLLRTNPIHAVLRGTDKKLCGGKFRSSFGDFSEPGTGKVTCEFCLGEINSADSVSESF